MPDPFSRPRRRRNVDWESTARFARYMTEHYTEPRRFQYARRVARIMRERGYPSYVIRTAIRAIHNGQDPRYSLDDYYMEERD